MKIDDFLRQAQADVRSQIDDRRGEPDSAYPYPESVFAEVVMDHMSAIGMTFDDPEVCHYTASVGNAKLRLSPENSWRVPIPVQTQEPPYGTSAVLTTTCATTEALV